MLVTLYLWAVVAAGSSGRLYQDWVPRGEYHSVELCQKAIGQLGVEPNHTRCIITKEQNER